LTRFTTDPTPAAQSATEAVPQQLVLALTPARTAMGRPPAVTALTAAGPPQAAGPPPRMAVTCVPAILISLAGRDDCVRRSASTVRRTVLMCAPLAARSGSARRVRWTGLWRLRSAPSRPARGWASAGRPIDRGVTGSPVT